MDAPHDRRPRTDLDAVADRWEAQRHVPYQSNRNGMLNDDVITNLARSNMRRERASGRLRSDRHARRLDRRKGFCHPNQISKCHDLLQIDPEATGFLREVDIQLLPESEHE